MKKCSILKLISLVLTLTFVIPMFSCGNKESTPTTTVQQEKEEPKVYSSESLFTILPAPKEVKLEGDKNNYVVYNVKPCISTNDEAFVQYVNAFVDYANRLNGVALTFESGGIELKRDSKLKAGQYSIVCDKNGIAVSASDNDGITYGLATLHQILKVDNGTITVPSYTILDQPDCSYRAVMIDLARNWHTLDEIKDYIDLCYLYKIKFIHLHFTDDQSYTLPSKAFPKLSTVRRSYTQAQIEALNQYALDRNIEIIPEIDLPGHATCIISAYPELFKHANSNEKRVICVGKPGMMDNLKTIFQEIMDMFPNSRYFHIGGDEADFSACSSCADCQKYMKDHNITSTKALYTHFIKEATDMVLSMGKTPVVWEGFPKEGAETISRDIVVTAWESLYHLPNDLIAEGFTVTNSSWQPMYIVYPEHPNVKDGRWQPMEIINEWNIYTWRNWWNASAAYNQPIVVEPTDQVIGGTVCVWETTYAASAVTVMENLSAASEKLWNVNGSVSNKKINDAMENLWTMASKLLDSGK